LFSTSFKFIVKTILHFEVVWMFEMLLVGLVHFLFAKVANGLRYGQRWGAGNFPVYLHKKWSACLPTKAGVTTLE
jgi:hypothetical protein